MLDYLRLELFPRNERRKRMVICLTEKLNASRVGQFPETVNHFRGITLELFQHRAGNGKCHAESPFMLPDQLRQQPVGRQITCLRDPLEYGPVCKIVIIMRIAADIEETVLPQPIRLMHLKVQTYSLFHNLYL